MANKKKQEDEFVVLEVTLPESVREGAINRLFELGAGGVEEGVTSQSGNIRAFFPVHEGQEAKKAFQSYLDSLISLFPGLVKIEVRSSLIPNENWAEKYKEFYHPRKLANLFYLIPTWKKQEVTVPHDRIALYLEPGQAFGTGLHPSTQLCLFLLERTMKDVIDPGNVNILDVGTGTGVLAIAAQKLGARTVVAIDNDPIAVEAAHENCLTNHAQSVEVSGKPLSEIEGPFDVILSNILLDTHRELAQEYGRLIKRGGSLIVSGLLADQRTLIDELFLQSGYVKGEETTLQEWTALTYIRI